MPKPKYGSKEYYKVELGKERNKNRFAWAQYFNIQHDYHELLLNHYNEYRYIQNEEANYGGDWTKESGSGQIEGISNHYKKVVQDLYEKAKAQVECSICLETIESKDLEMTNCGHSYHKRCLELFMEANQYERYVPCPECREKVWNKKYSN